MLEDARRELLGLGRANVSDLKVRSTRVLSALAAVVEAVDHDRGARAQLEELEFKLKGFAGRAVRASRRPAGCGLGWWGRWTCSRTWRRDAGRRRNHCVMQLARLQRPSRSAAPSWTLDFGGHRRRARRHPAVDLNRVPGVALTRPEPIESVPPSAISGYLAEKIQEESRPYGRRSSGRRSTRSSASWARRHSPRPLRTARTTPRQRSDELGSLRAVPQPVPPALASPRRRRRCSWWCFEAKTPIATSTTCCASGRNLGLLI